MLTTCPECSLPVSNKAFQCPHCGFPLKENTVKSLKKKSAKRKRLPNGFGQITKVTSKKLRNPYRVLVCTGKTSKGNTETIDTGTEPSANII